ncbi:FeoC-like transcriptional regulator [Candidatus Sodalis sp. SoCistrobi]|uniref:FeoC-like transcriptional regulator n=1 Tax=Candidatus Sodalis sp. SoCistrobi TaxID=1922216 RepID=UPI00093FD811|nr:FeoC-like transcriptional regulator [Candidatus Sodalis sp. SoCistrobi]
MSGLMQLRDALELMGQGDARTLGLRLRLPQAMAAAMLERLEMMGQVERVAGDDTAAGACRSCERSSRCRLPCYRLRPSAAAPATNK